jgi:hypothetical protein
MLLRPLAQIVTGEDVERKPNGCMVGPLTRVEARCFAQSSAGLRGVKMCQRTALCLSLQRTNTENAKQIFPEKELCSHTDKKGNKIFL